MSLRKKYYAQRGISQGRAGFSTSGTTRTGSYVGKTSVNSSVHTPFRGPEPVGHGGCCGTYKVSVVNECCASTPSNGQGTMTSSGLFLSRVQHPTSVYNADCDSKCAAPVYMDTSPLNHSSGSHTKTLVSQQMAGCYSLKTTNGIWNCTGNCDAASYHIGGKKYVFEPYARDVAPLSSSEYMTTGLAKKTCAQNSSQGYGKTN